MPHSVHPILAPEQIAARAMRDLRDGIGTRNRAKALELVREECRLLWEDNLLTGVKSEAELNRLVETLVADAIVGLRAERSGFTSAAREEIAR